MQAMWHKFVALFKKVTQWLKNGRNILLVLALLFFVPLFLIALSVTYRTLWMATNADVYSGFGFAALIAAILGAPFIIWRTWVAHQDYKVKEQGHITDRINKAVEGLGAEKTVKQVCIDGATSEFTQPNLEVRIGSIYALERIAQDSLRDHIQVMEIICAYVRENAPVSNALELKQLNEKRNIGPRTDIQISLNVLGRRQTKQIEIENKVGYRLDLRNTCLQRVNLSEFNFENAIFAYSNLALSFLIRTRLKGVSFIFCDLSGAQITNTSLEKANLHNSDFFKSTLLGLSFKQTKNLKNLDLKKVNSSGFLSFQKINLKESEIDQGQIDNSFGDGSVLLHETINWPDRWPVMELNDKEFEIQHKKWLKDPQNYIPPRS